MLSSAAVAVVQFPVVGTLYQNRAGPEGAVATGRCYAALVSSRAERRASTSFCAERPKKW
jgi:hypothetical protein